MLKLKLKFRLSPEAQKRSLMLTSGQRLINPKRGFKSLPASHFQSGSLAGGSAVERGDQRHGGGSGETKAKKPDLKQGVVAC